MEWSDIYFLVWIIFIYAWGFITRGILPMKQHQDIAGVFGIVILCVGMVAQDYYFVIKTAPYAYIRAFIRPLPKEGRDVAHFFIKKWNSQKSNPKSLQYTTKVELAFETKLPEFGKVKRIILEHLYPFEKRFQFAHGLAVYKEYPVKHPNTATAIFYQYPSAYEVDRGEVVPKFKLANAPQDVYLPPLVLGGKGMKLNPKLGTVQNLQHKISVLKSENATLRRGKRDEHQKRIELQEFLTDLKNELIGVLKRKVDVVRSAWELMLVTRKEQINIENALQQRKPWKGIFGKWLMWPIVIVAGLVFVAAIPDIRIGFAQWVSIGNNQVFLLLFACVMVVGIYFGVYRRRAK